MDEEEEQERGTGKQPKQQVFINLDGLVSAEPSSTILSCCYYRLPYRIGLQENACRKLFGSAKFQLVESEVAKSVGTLPLRKVKTTFALSPVAMSYENSSGLLQPDLAKLSRDRKSVV